MKKWISLLGVLFAAIAVLAGCRADTYTDTVFREDGRVRVVVSFHVLKEFTEAVGKDKVECITLIPDGTEPHDFQPTTKSLKALSKADVLICNGLGMEPWADKAIEVVENKDLHIVDASQGINAISLGHSKHHRHGHEVYDPHCWLSLSCAQVEVQNIADALSQADPDNGDFYQANAAAYKAQLQELLASYQKRFRTVSSRQFVTGHAAFAYLCRDFNLTQNSVESVFAEGEPSTHQLARLVDYCRVHHVKTIFTEEMVSPKTSQTLADEVHADVKTIYTMESSEENTSYIERMRENLDKIYTSLQ